MSRILVTGASDGIGKSLALELTKEGHELVLFGRNEQRLKSVAAMSNDAEYHAFDMNDYGAMVSAVDKVLANGDIDVLINNAGIWHKIGDLEAIPEELIKEVITTNLTSQILLTQKILPHLRNRENSFIVNIVSKSGVTAQEGQSVYSASKWGLRGFTDVLRADTKNDKVHVIGVYQSGTNTKLFEKAGDDFPIEQFTNPDDLAKVIAFTFQQPPKLRVTEIRIDR
ncbi:MAG: SDR family oxidoreductase [Candidatus Saccharimonadales bacterium]